MSKKLTIGYVKTKTGELADGYECLSEGYINNGVELLFKCRKGHIYKATWRNFYNKGHRCLICYYQFRAGNSQRLTLEFVKGYIEKAGYRCLSKKYKNSKTKLRLQCSKGHIHNICWSDFKSGYRCLICHRENNRGENHQSWKNYSEEDIKEMKDYKLNVEQLTQHNFRKYHSLVDPKRLRGKVYHLDHIYTIADGFKNTVPPEVIASPVNLQMLTASNNMSKNGRSNMTKETLYKLYNQFKKEVKEMYNQ